MKFTKFSKYTGEPADSVNLEELIKKLGDFFLQSGFESPFYGMNEFDPERSMEALREAILRALQDGDLFDENSLPEEMRQMLNRSDAMNNEQIRDLIEELIKRMAQEGFINPQQPPQITPPNQVTARGSVGQPMDRNQSQVRFEITTRLSTSSVSKRCKTFSARSAAAASAVTTRATSLLASSPAASRVLTNSATRSIS